VFVNTCYGAFQGTSSAFSGIAQCLHAIGVADVVALQFQLLDTTAHAIVLNFYRYLLREGNSVEDSITKVRRDLFMNGYIFPESFGLTMYQGKLNIRGLTQTSPQSASSVRPMEFNQFTEMFGKKIEKEILNKVSSELDRTILTLKELASTSMPRAPRLLH